MRIPDAHGDQFDSQTEAVCKAVHLCTESRLHLPALMLLYAAVDGLAWTAGTAQDSRADFEAWVATYLLPLADARPRDIYAARCAVLHTQTAVSRSSQDRDPQKSGLAREVWYTWPDGSALANLALNSPRLPLVIRFTGLLDAFDASIRRFQKALANDKELRARVFARTNTYFSAVQL